MNVYYTCVNFDVEISNHVSYTKMTKSSVWKDEKRCIIHYLEITILSFVYSSHVYLFHHQTLHMCTINPYDQVELFSEFFETLNVIFKVFKIKSSNTPEFQNSILALYAVTYLGTYVSLLLVKRHTISLSKN